MTKEDWQADSAEVEAIVSGRHPNPFGFLGLQEVHGQWVLRAFIPHAEVLSAFTLDGTALGHLIPRHADGFFEGKVAIDKRQPIRYRAKNAGGEWDVHDPYSFGPVLGPMDDYYMGEGSHLRLFDKLGAHEMAFEGIHGTHFAVWAPNAQRVSVVGPFNDWDGRRNPMRNRFENGIWEVFIPVLGTGTLYKFEIVGPDGVTLPLKADPFARQSEMRPKTASVVPDPTPFTWTDEKYLAERATRDWRRTPMSIYEVHLGSWRRRPDGGFLSYDQLAEQLVPYVADMGYTHIELLPISEHPYDPSWGYQPTGLYAPTARFGDPAGFARFVDAAHEAGLGVILDWVPAHFPTDAHGLANFDGTALYEHADPRQGFHPDWNTAIYNFGRKEVVSFLVNNALYWLEKFHIDGLRVDAVASMLYLDYSRQQGEWVPNKFGGNQNLEAVEFLRRVNTEAYRLHPGTFMIAEESTSWPGVSKPVDAGGLGFGFKWNMGFMNDTLRFMSREPVHRKFHHNDMTFGTVYAFSENFVLPLSHDEVVHGKGSLLEKMPGDDWQKFANLRAYFGFMWGQPGKKLLFMGQEFAQREEWADAKSLDWYLLDASMHEGMRRLIADLNLAYRELPALHERDCEPEGFEWVIGNDHANSVLAWLRKAPGGDPILVVSNFTPMPRSGYKIPMPMAGKWVERINTDAGWYAGSNTGNQGVVEAYAVEGRHWPAEAEIYLPPLSTLFLKLDQA
ncbi:MAG TPA: 1,4-alpha-glucan branching protein GlgB [Devosia sp.]|uniref:1,4-alpha-glucan branching protein GlgB n=1 Tax=Devosia sp. TaxID=1871048 RepID=UPI002735783A|nr:1,4-alpha-glucan branching protein GlgB [Devosia sp.]MDP2782312.1 1,4-alpha-glucan branching protein GlgB [Devosia sp.]HLV82548.1 1,4-alpha-glucan branching protein GlgB [Devosia sp.]